MTYRTLLAALVLTGAAVAAPATATAATSSPSSTPKATFSITINKVIKISKPKVDTVDFTGTYTCAHTDPNDVIQFFFGVTQTHNGKTVNTGGDQLQDGTSCDGHPHKYQTSTLNNFGGQFQVGSAIASVNASTHDLKGNTVTKNVSKSVIICTTYCQQS
jgi:hypothetical protein